VEKALMAAVKPYREHLTSSEDLVTPYEAVRAGFVALALEKNRRATPFVAQARALKASASRANIPGELVTIEDIQPALLTAAGISDKAAGHLQPQDKMEAIQGLIKNFLEPAGADEHRKTARTALTRIQIAFSNSGVKPHTFFIGAAIERNMANEIWGHLEDDTLENAANLTDDNQIASVSRWLCNL
jgi:hypothetical protein